MSSLGFKTLATPPSLSKIVGQSLQCFDNFYIFSSIPIFHGIGGQMVGGGSNRLKSGSPTHLLLEVGWGFNAPKSGNFFFEAFQHSHLAMLKAEWWLIEFVQISVRSDTSTGVLRSPSAPAAGHSCPPPNPHFVLRPILISFSQVFLLVFPISTFMIFLMCIN